MDLPELNTLSLCAGGGGLDLGLGLAIGNVRTVCWVEWEAYAIDYLASCMEAECLHPAPIYTQLRSFDGRPWRGIVDIVTAGYPCQPFSLAGKRGGSNDHRHLWPEVHRVIGEVEPSIVFLENVSGHLSLGAEQVFSELQGLDYDVAAGLFTAAEVGATQKRERLFILAVANREHGWWGRCAPRAGQGVGTVASGPSDRMVFPPCPEDKEGWGHISTHFWPATEPGLSNVVDGLAAERAPRRKLLGNGVVPLQAAYAFLSLWSVLRERVR